MGRNQVRASFRYAFIFPSILWMIVLPGCRKTPPVVEGLMPADGFRIYYKTVGSGEPLFLLQGGPGLEHTYLRPQMERLAGRYRLVFSDQRYIGKSEGILDSAKVTFDGFVQDVDSLRKSLGFESIHILGHSFGGLTAMAYAARFPDRVRTLVLMNSAGPDYHFFEQFGENLSRRMSDTDSLKLEEILRSDEYRNRRPEAHRGFLRTLFKSYFSDTSQAVQLNLAMTENTSRNRGKVNTWIWQDLGEYDLRAEIARIACPTLVIHGDSDPVPLESALAIQKAIPQSKIVVLQKTGHFPYIEKPGRLFKVLNQFYNKPHAGSISLK